MRWKDYASRPPAGDWADNAACKHQTSVMYPSGYGAHLQRQRDQARALCAACDVKVECLTHALTYDEPDGIWGGLGPDERRNLIYVRLRTA